MASKENTSGLMDALIAIDGIAKMFAPLATVSADVGRLKALVSHEAELKQSIADMLNEKAQIDASCRQRIAETDATIAARQKAQSDTEASYDEARAALSAEYQAAKIAARNAIDGEKAKADAEINGLRASAEAVKKKIADEHAKIASEHEAFIAETKQHRAQIEANTQALQDTLDSVRAELAPLMKD